jgi:hypothetical protein
MCATHQRDVASKTTIVLGHREDYEPAKTRGMMTVAGHWAAFTVRSRSMARYLRLTAFLAALLALAGLANSCRSTKSPPAVDPALASYVPAGTLVLAGLNLDQIRATALYRSLPPNALTALQSLRDASYLLIASNSRDLLLLARGTFREAPPGATLVSSEIAIAGPAESIRAAIAQHRTAVTGSQRLLDLAAGVAGGRQMWAVAQGGVTLPLPGNFANLNRILHFTDYVTLSAQIDSRIQVEATGVGRTADGTRQLEESLRAILTFGAAAGGRKSEIGTMLNAVEIRREGLTVHATLSTTPEAAEKLIGQLSR